MNKVVQRDIEADGGHDVVGLAAVNNGACLVKYQRAHKQHDARRNSELESRQIDEQAEQNDTQQADHADHHEIAHEAEVFLRLQCNGAQGEKDKAGSAERCHHEVTAVRHRSQVSAEQRPEGNAHEAGQSKHAHDTRRRVTEFRRQEQQSEITNERDDRPEVG